MPRSLQATGLGLRFGKCLALGVAWSLAIGMAGAWAQEDAVAGAKTTAQARVAAAESARADGESLRQDADWAAAEARDSQLVSVWQRAEQLLAAARSAMAEAETAPSANAFRDAGILANGSRRAFEDFAGRGQRALRQIEAERAPPPPPPVAEPEPSPAAEDPVDESASQPGSATPTGPQGQQDPAASSAKDVVDPPAETTTPTPPSAAPSPPPPSTQRPRPQPQLPALTSMAPPLRRAVEAYFQGDDESVLQALATPNDLGSGVHKAHALMVRAAARYHLFLMGGERDHAQRSAAVEDVMTCRRLVADLAPSRDLFSPRFVDFFSGVQLPTQR